MITSSEAAAMIGALPERGTSVCVALVAMLPDDRPAPGASPPVLGARGPHSGAAFLAAAKTFRAGALELCGTTLLAGCVLAEPAASSHVLIHAVGVTRPARSAACSSTTTAVLRSGGR